MKVPFLDLAKTYLELKDDLSDSFERVMARGRYIQGEELNLFETEFAKYCGVKYCVGVANGLDAILLLLEAYEIKKDDEVIVPTNTFIATWLAVSRCGATIVPVEPDNETYNLDPTKVKNAITSKTKAIVAVHLYGQPADVEGLREVIKGTGIKLIEDAAQAHGAIMASKTVENRMAGNLADAAAFSFYPGKNLGAFGDGGAITTNDSELAMKVRMIGNYGSLRKYHHEFLGLNSRLDELQSALLRVKLKKLNDWNNRRAHIADIYQQSLKNIPGIRLPKIKNNMMSSWHLFVIRSLNRDELMSYLSSKNIDVLIHYPIPPHLSQAYKVLKYQRGDFPIAEKMSDEILSLPIGPHMSDEQAYYVVDAIKEFEVR